MQKIEQYDILHFMVINLEQTSTKFKPGSKSTLANGGSNSAQVGGANDKRNFCQHSSRRIRPYSADLWG